ncbi:MAG: DUF6481 family protein [Hyphomicrobium sp.]
MKAFKSPTFGERLGTATAAKKTALERFRARPASDDKSVVAQRAARQAVAAARELRAAERSEARRTEKARQAAELAARELADRAGQLQQADDRVDLEAQRKAARDVRYAARKARKA